MATIASDQISIMDLTDAYSVMLTLDSYTFQGDAGNVDASTDHTFQTQVVAMCGASIVEARVSLSEILPRNGVPFDYSIDTEGSGTNDGKSPVITITLPASRAGAVTAAGTIRIPVKVAGVTVNKEISYSVAHKGTEGNGVAGTVVEYAASESGTVAPQTGWQTGVPTVAQGQFLWTRTTVNYTSGEPSVSYSVALHGTDGDDTILVKVISSNGILFKNNNNSTTLTAQVFRGATPLGAAEINALGIIMWYKNGKLITAAKGSRTLEVVGSDVSGSTVFEAKLEG